MESIESGKRKFESSLMIKSKDEQVTKETEEYLVVRENVIMDDEEKEELTIWGTLVDIVECDRSLGIGVKFSAP